MKIFALLACATVAMIAGGCAAGPRDMDRMIQMLERDDPAKFEPVMRSFVAFAIAGDAEGMISLTSKVTIQQTGIEKLRQHYLADTIPAIQRFPQMMNSGRVHYVDDRKGTTGWAYKQDFMSATGKKAKIQFVVLREQGEICVSSVGLWK